MVGEAWMREMWAASIHLIQRVSECGSDSLVAGYASEGEKSSSIPQASLQAVARDSIARNGQGPNNNNKNEASHGQDCRVAKSLDPPIGPIGDCEGSGRRLGTDRESFRISPSGDFMATKGSFPRAAGRRSSPPMLPG